MKKVLSIILLALCLAACGDKESQEDNSSLRFSDGTFRIAQFTDIHWVHGEESNSSKQAMLLAAIEAEHPDVCVLTGDIVTGGNPREGWSDIVSILEEGGAPYIVLMGNHDPEQWAKDSIYSFLRENGPHHIGSRVLEKIDDHYSGVLRVLQEESDSTALALYLIDSGDYYDDPLVSFYDNIHLAQIDWYAAQSAQLTKENGGTPVPALAFFHICVPEYEQLAQDPSKLYGHFCEVCCPSEINSGFFSAVKEKGDVMGMFVGHDHANDFMGLHKGVALGYGRQSGVILDYPLAPMGCRIIELREGERAFDTWLWTPAGEEQHFYYPTGITSDMEEQANYLPAAEDIDEGTLLPGVNYTYFEGQGGEKTIDAMLTGGEVKDSGVMEKISISSAPAEDHFGYIFDTLFLAEQRGVYLFSMMSDDGARLYIDGECIIDLDGSHSAEPKDGYVALEKGYHTLCVQYFEDYMGQQLDLWLTTRSTLREPLPARLLFVKNLNN